MYVVVAIGFCFLFDFYGHYCFGFVMFVNGFVYCESYLFHMSFLLLCSRIVFFFGVSFYFNLAYDHNYFCVKYLSLVVILFEMYHPEKLGTFLSGNRY